MLFDPKWEVKTDLFALQPLIAWLATQPRWKEYEYFDNCGCLLHQYFTHRGFRTVDVGGFGVTLDGQRYEMPDAFSDIPCIYPRTFGGALKRARKLARTTGQ